MPDMIIFGAGASFGSDVFNVPPPASHLVDELISFQSDSWGQIGPRLLSLFREDFEKGMKRLSEKKPRSMAPLRRSMAEFFFRFAPGPNNLYRKLARRIRQSRWDGVLATFNYERLLELSLIFEGLQPVAEVPQAPNHIEVCLPHGCCHLFGEPVGGSASTISSNGRAVGTKGPVRAVFEPDEFRARICYGAFPPVMNYFNRGKRNTSEVNFMVAQRSRFKEAVLNCSRIAIIGLKVRPRDRHIWGPLARTSASLIYCSRETAAEKFKKWAKKWRSGTDEVFDGDFDKHFDDICNELGIGSGTSSAARKASSRAKAKNRARAYAKAREETEAKAQAEAEKRAQVEAEAREKAKFYTEQIAAAKAEASEMIAKFRAKAEQRASMHAAAIEEAESRAESEARLRSEVEKKAKGYVAAAEKAVKRLRSEIEERVKAEVKAEAESRYRFEAEEMASSEAEARTKAEKEAKAEAKARAKTEKRAESERQAKIEAENKARFYAQSLKEAKAKVETEARLRAELQKETKLYAKARQEAETRAEARLRTETQEKIKSYDGEIAKIKVEATEMIANQRAKSETEVAKTIASLKTAETVGDTFGSATEKKHAKPTTRKKLPFNSIGALLAIRAKDITQKDIVWGTGNDSVEEALTKMQERDTGYMMIGRDGLLEGIVSKSDLTGALSPYLRRTFAKWHRPVDDATLQIKIKSIMSKPVQTIRSDTSLAVIMKNMHLSDGRCLPVVNEQGKVEGLVTVFDIFKALLKSNPDISTAGKTLQAPPLLAKLKVAGQGQKPARCLDTAHAPC
jgi:CBS domain-containing protein